MEAKGSPARRATAVSAGTALLLIAVKLAVGLATGTVSVLASAVDSLLDFAVSSFNVFAVSSSERPSDAHYNYGRGKMEGVASVAEGLIILASAAFLAYRSLAKLSAPGAPAAMSLDWALAVMLFSTACTWALVAFLGRVARRTDSLVVRADILHYRTDLLTNAGVFLALIVIRFTHWGLVDPLVALAIAGYIGYSAWPLLRQGMSMLLDRALDPALVDAIRSAATGHSDRVRGVHELKTRRSANTYFVDFHLVLDEDIRLGDAHHIADDIEARIRKLGRGVWIVNIHLDPYDDSPRDRHIAKTVSKP